MLHVERATSQPQKQEQSDTKTKITADGVLILLFPKDLLFFQIIFKHLLPVVRRKVHTSLLYQNKPAELKIRKSHAPKKLAADQHCKNQYQKWM